MVFRAVKITLLCTLVLLTGCSRKNWLNYRGEDGSGRTKTVIQPPLGIKWKLLLQDKDKVRESFNPPAVYGHSLYFGSADGNLYALDINSGYMEWVFRTAGPINSVPTADKDGVYIGSSDGYIYSLDRNTGQLNWSFRTRAPVNSTIVLHGDRIFAISDADALYCLDRETGELLWSLANPIWLRNSFQIWEDTVFFSPGPPESPQTLACYDTVRREYTWYVDTALDMYNWYSFPALKEDRLYYAASGFMNGEWQYRFSCLDRETGETLWQRFDVAYLDSRIDGLEAFRESTEQLDYLAPALYKNRVFFTAGDMKLRTFHGRTGEILWEKRFDQPLSGAPLVGGSRLFVGLKESEELGLPGQLVCLSGENGRELWRMEIEGSLLSAPVISGHWLIFGTDRNLFYVLEEVF
ncbi:MAG: PQQ-binding-like beta-propeller repeat protein [Spirochaetales bacterium]|nr:PQQ-binding-like beta-propeller repeat protein [Spirochaetales bacterium]